MVTGRYATDAPNGAIRPRGTTSQGLPALAIDATARPGLSCPPSQKCYQGLNHAKIENSSSVALW